ncbi:Ankyrin [Echinococcus multilocularis]|uniref:asparaginase n=1 Tax=Echinococcus multilocularis TaxID=6211 RepID=A0A068Y0Q3_ECHMU|nr:Ankyrin [Echinococcus multilocularis]
MQKESGVYKPKQHFLTSYLFQMPIFNDHLFWEHAPLFYSSTSLPPTSIKTSTPSTVSLPLALPLDEDKRRILYRLLEYDTLLDSSDCQLEVWINLAKDLERFYDYFDGFVILHGTDTLPYAASALSFILENLTKPVVMTGSELPIDRLRNDGRINLLGSLLFAGGGYNIPEVTVFIQNELYRGNRIVKAATTDLEAFLAPNSQPLAVMDEHVKVYKERIWTAPKQASKPLRVQSNLCPNVAILRLFPSISIDAVRSFFQPPMQGVILETFGTGNIPSNNAELVEVLKEAHEVHNIVILNVTQCWKGTVANVYATGAILSSVGAVSGCDITTEAALMKMAYVLGKWDNPATQRRMLSHSLRGEMTEPSVETRSHRRHSVSTSQSSEASASKEMTTALGETLVNVEAAGLARQWSENLFHSLICAAADNDDVEMLEQLLHISGHFEYTDSRRIHPLHVAAGAGAYAACRLMLENGVSANVADARGFTPLSYAVRARNCTPALISMLLQFGCRLPHIVSARAREANIAASNGRLKQLRFYRLAGLTLQELDAEGRSPLHTAVAYHQREVVRYLITPAKTVAIAADFNDFDQNELFELGGAGVDPNHLTGYGTTALEEARKRNFLDIVQILESASGTH